MPHRLRLPQPIRLRPAAESDFEFLYALHAVTMKEYVEATWGWDETFQKARFRETFDPGDTRIVTLDGRDIGMVSMEENESEVFLALIEIDPKHQHRGFGTAIIEQVIADGVRKRKPVFLHVLKVNPAKRLYDRLGFLVVEETPTHFYMRRPLSSLGTLDETDQS
jgi:ribosomal protein S18 acetylase RimI-like enzyme